MHFSKTMWTRSCSALTDTDDDTNIFCGIFPLTCSWLFGQNAHANPLLPTVSFHLAQNISLEFPFCTKVQQQHNQETVEKEAETLVFYHTYTQQTRMQCSYKKHVFWPRRSCVMVMTALLTFAICSSSLELALLSLCPHWMFPPLHISTQPPASLIYPIHSLSNHSMTNGLSLMFTSIHFLHVVTCFFLPVSHLYWAIFYLTNVKSLAWSSPLLPTHGTVHFV